MRLGQYAHGPRVFAGVGQPQGNTRAAIVGEDLILSARTRRGYGNAESLLRKTLQGIGSSGGHAHRAGGKIADVGQDAKVAQDVYDKLRNRWLDACQVQRRRGTRLIPAREIVDNLRR